jgi:hypothetical protein
MYQQLWGYKVEQKLYLGVREQKRLNTTGLEGRGPQPLYIDEHYISCTLRQRAQA